MSHTFHGDIFRDEWLLETAKDLTKRVHAILVVEMKRHLLGETNEAPGEYIGRTVDMIQAALQRELICRCSHVLAGRGAQSGVNDRMQLCRSHAYLQRGGWEPAMRRGSLTAIVTCPQCGRPASLARHEIASTGDVQPSVACPYDDCDFCQGVTLGDWEQEGEPCRGWHRKEAGE